MNKYLTLLPRDREGTVPGATAIAGWSDKKIQALRAEYKYELPPAYLEFLKLMGNRIDAIPPEYYNLFGIRYSRMNEAHTFICSAGIKHLGPRNFFFWAESEYSSCFFNIDEGDDPPVYITCLAQYADEPVKLADTLSSFVDKRRNNELVGEVLIDCVLMKSIERGESLESIQRSIASVKLANLPPEIAKKIATQYDGPQRQIVSKMASDFIAEKSKYSHTLEGLDALLDLTNGSFNQLQNRYFSFVFNDDWDPAMLIEQKHQQ